MNLWPWFKALEESPLGEPEWRFDSSEHLPIIASWGKVVIRLDQFGSSASVEFDGLQQDVVFTHDDLATNLVRLASLVESERKQKLDARLAAGCTPCSECEPEMHHWVSTGRIFKAWGCKHCAHKQWKCPACGQNCIGECEVPF